MDKIINPLDWEMDLLWDTKSDIVRKLNPLNWRLEVVYKADSYIQKINPFIWDFDMVWGTGAEYIIKEVTWNWYINLTNAIANHLMELKAYGWTEQRNLPAGYTQYEYLRSSGTQYINLGYKGNWNTKVEVKFKYHTVTSATGSGRVFGSRITSSNNAFAIGTSSWVVSDTNNKIFWCYDGQPYYVDEEDTFGLDVWQTVVFSATEHTINWVTEWDDYEVTEFETPNNLLLFAFDNNGTVGVGYVDIAYCKLWNNWVLVRDLIPCKNGSNVLGMYDRVSETLLTNAGTGTFWTWNTAVPTPEKPMNIVSNNGVLKLSKNMANVNAQTALVWYYISSSWVVTVDNNNRIYQDYIPCKPNTTYTLSMSSEVYYVTISEYSTAEDSGFIVRDAGTSWWNTQLTITTGATTNYLRFGTNIDRTGITLEEVLAINWQLERWATPTPYHEYVAWWIYTDWTTETIEDELSNTATAEMLLAFWDTKDVQEVLSWSITRSVWVKVLDWTEDWVKATWYTWIYYCPISWAYYNDESSERIAIPCTHFLGTDAKNTDMENETIKLTAQWSDLTNPLIYIKTTAWSNNLNNFKARLTDQYSSLTPVIVVYPLKTPTTETVTGQTLNIQTWSNTIEITQASIDNLWLYAKYKATA